MYTRSDNIEIIFGDDNDDIIEQLFESLLQKYEEKLQNKMRGSEFEFDGINFLYYDFNKTGINRGGSYIDSPKRLKNKKSTINPKNNDDKCFQYAVTLALNLDKIKKDPQRVSKIKPFIEKYNWEDIDFPSSSKDWKKFECNNEVALNTLDAPYNTQKINIAYKSKNILTQEKQIILLMISDGQKWHYLVVKNLSRLLRGITSNHKEDFYCLNCFHSYRTENKLEAHKKICENHDYCHVEMPIKNNNIIKYNHGEKSMKLPFVIYADLECLLEKMKTCINNPNESSTTKINKHTPSGYSNTFKYKNKIIGNTYNVNVGADGYDVNTNGTQEVELAIPLKYLGNFWRALNIPLISCEVPLELKWDKNCIITSLEQRDVGGGNRDNASTGATLPINDCKLYVPAVTLSKDDEIKLLTNLKSGFKREIIRNKYRSQMTTEAVNNNLKILIDPTFTNVNRLFVLAYQNADDRHHFLNFIYQMLW